MAIFYARLINQQKLKNHTIFSASFYKINEEDQKGDETDFFNNLNLSSNLTESVIDNNDVKSQLEQQIQIQDTKESGWIIDKINSMKIRFYKIGELNGSSYIEMQ